MRYGIVVCIIALSVPAQAAEITILSSDEPGGVLHRVVISGRLVAEDTEAFRLKAGSLQGRVGIGLMSEGGSITAGVEIGRMIRLRGWNTVVPPGATCASACALIWLGGIQRLIYPASKLGFHASYILRDGVAHEHGASNALVGGYLNQLGLSDPAIRYITSAAPSSMTWMTQEDANRYGISHKMMEDKPAPAAMPSATLPTTPTPPWNAVKWILYVREDGQSHMRTVGLHTTQAECLNRMTSLNEEISNQALLVDRKATAVCVAVDGAHIEPKAPEPAPAAPTASPAPSPKPIANTTWTASVFAVHQGTFYKVYQHDFASQADCQKFRVRARTIFLEKLPVGSQVAPRTKCVPKGVQR